MTSWKEFDSQDEMLGQTKTNINKPLLNAGITDDIYTNAEPKPADPYLNLTREELQQLAEKATNAQLMLVLMNLNSQYDEMACQIAANSLDDVTNLLVKVDSRQNGTPKQGLKAPNLSKKVDALIADIDQSIDDFFSKDEGKTMASLNKTLSVAYDIRKMLNELRADGLE